MNKTDVLNCVAKDSNYLNYCKRVAAGYESFEDLYQFCFLELSQKEESYLVEKFQSGELIKIFAGIAYKSYNSTTSPFYKAYQKYYTLHTKKLDNEVNTVTEKSSKKTLSESIVNREIELFRLESPSNEYAVSLFEVYLECKSFRELEKKTGIYYRTAHKTIQKLRNEIKNRCQKYY